ncbi:hypothetical protein [Paenibacillus tuaregi]|uniref:hypothetical protein n=1 Tax=Paenibacillus tuaregi TaxID=1816681 RepID=UPI00083922A5|nr:hypothetical protein [Paenibacillus tuaregi]
MWDKTFSQRMDIINNAWDSKEAFLSFLIRELNWERTLMYRMVIFDVKNEADFRKLYSMWDGNTEGFRELIFEFHEYKIRSTRFASYREFEVSFQRNKRLALERLFQHACPDNMVRQFEERLDEGLNLEYVYDTAVVQYVSALNYISMDHRKLPEHQIYPQKASRGLLCAESAAEGYKCELNDGEA